MDKNFENDQTRPTMLRYVTLKFCISKNSARIRLLMNSYLLHTARWKSDFCLNLMPCINKAYDDDDDNDDAEGLRVILLTSIYKS